MNDGTGGTRSRIALRAAGMTVPRTHRLRIFRPVSCDATVRQPKLRRPYSLRRRVRRRLHRCRPVKGRAERRALSLPAAPCGMLKLATRACSHHGHADLRRSARDVWRLALRRPRRKDIPATGLRLISSAGDPRPVGRIATAWASARRVYVLHPRAATACRAASPDAHETPLGRPGM